jgi:myo-inositol-1-phosphate synthase
MASVNVGIVGVGNCASSLVQGLAFYGIDDVRVDASPRRSEPIEHLEQLLLA